LAVGLAADAAFAQAAPRVERFTPQGTAQGVRQVEVRFSAPIVRFGDPRGPDPFEVDCAPRGRAHWADPRTWILDFDAELPAGVRCRFRLRDALRTVDGQPLGGARDFAFSTGGPRIRWTDPGGGSDVAEDQRFALALDAEPDPASVVSHACFAVSGLADCVGVRLVEGEERAAALRALQAKPEDGRLLVLEPRQRFAPGASLALRWGRGIATRTGVETEAAQVFEYTVRKAFVASVRCERERAESDCVPLRPIRLAFSAPVAIERAQAIALVVAGDHPEAGRSFRAERVSRDDGDPLVDAVLFRGPFPERARLRVALPPDLTDDAGRALATGELEARTAGDPPLARFPGRFGIVESGAGALLPVTIRNLGAEGPGAPAGRLIARRITVDGSDAGALLAVLRETERAELEGSVFEVDSLPGEPQELALPLPQGSDPFQVIGIPLGGPGLHLIEIESEVLGRRLTEERGPMFVATAALATDLAVHFKWGAESSLVWVTSLGSGQPAAGARVSVHDCLGALLWQGTSDADGLARPQGLPSRSNTTECRDREGWSEYDEGLLVTAVRSGDLGLAHTSMSDGIEPWRFRLPTEWRPRPFAAHTILDRSLLRAGDTLHMKHVLRRASLAGFEPLPVSERPTRVRVTHVGTGQRSELPVAFEADGSAVGELAIPPAARLGSYEVALVAGEGDAEKAVTTGGFRVEEFRVPLAQGVLRAPQGPLVAPREVPIDLAVRYLAGGGAAGLAVKLRTQVRPRELPEIEGLESFALARGPVSEGIRRLAEGAEADASEAETDARKTSVTTQDLVLDASGTARAVVTDVPAQTKPAELLAELEFRDPAGETRTAARSIPLWPSDQLVGIRLPASPARGEPLRIEASVSDVGGRPRWLRRVVVEAYERRIYTSRKRLVGGFYAYDDVEEIRRLGVFCEGRTSRRGRLVCHGAPPGEGNLVFVARSGDAATHDDVWLAGEDGLWFGGGDSDRMDVIPDAPKYRPGDVARLQVRMPFREATALVSIEREGVAGARVVRLSGKDPTLAVPIEGAHAPNVFVSVLAVRGRVAEPPPTATIDLARPSFRIGIAELRVDTEANRLGVEVDPERETYAVRDRARVRIAVETPTGEPPAPGSEVAVAAVDEGLLELWPNASWKLLEALQGRRRYAVHTSTAQMQVVGRRHFGQKARPPGGGGGRASTRELFDTLLYWNPRVPLDAEGRATVEIPTNDSLTSFRIVAVATAGDALFGTGESRIRTTQDVMVLPGVAPIVRSGDRTRAEITLRNTTAQEVPLRVSATAEGLGDALPPQEIALPAATARDLAFGFEAPAGVGELGWLFEIASGERVLDRVRVRQRVLPATPERVVAAVLDRAAPELRLPVEMPGDALPGRGGLTVDLRPKLADGLPGVERAMREYPFSCLEQRVSVAVALRDREAFARVMQDLPSYLDDDGLASFFPQIRPGSDALTAYLLAIADAAGLEIPAEAKERMLAGLERTAAGALVRSTARGGPDRVLRKLAALAALARHGRPRAKLVASLRIEPRLWPTSGVLDWIEILKRVPDVPQRAQRLREAEAILRARFDRRGTALVLSFEERDRLDWILASPDANAVRAILVLLDAPELRDDLPLLVRGALAVQTRGQWATTLANAWGVVALERFSRAFEQTPPAGTTQAELAGESRAHDWAASPGGGALAFAWPGRAASLVVRHAGPGRPWALAQSRAAIPLREPLFVGYRVAKRIEPVLQQTPGSLRRGDVVRVHLDVEAQSDHAWVVVEDPIPAGASILGSGLGGDSRIATAGESGGGTAWSAFTERKHDVFRRYYEFAERGAWSLEYSLRVNQAGSFRLPPTRVEAMYAPEVFGELPNPDFEVEP
jgi:hypothetical protein